MLPPPARPAMVATLATGPHSYIRSRLLTADDVGCTLRVECIDAFGGEPVSASTSVPVAIDELTKTNVAKIRKRGEATFPVRSITSGETRTILLVKEKIKVRSTAMKDPESLQVQPLAMHTAPQHLSL